MRDCLRGQSREHRGSQRLCNQRGRQAPRFCVGRGFRSTGRRDYTTKREGYAAYGVEEYWRFDYTGGRFHDASLAGDILVGKEYRPLPINRDPNGLVWGYSPKLYLELRWNQGQLRFSGHYTKEFLPTPEEERLIRDEETVRANNAEAQAHAERQAPMEAEERLRLLESKAERRQDT